MTGTGLGPTSLRILVFALALLLLNPAQLEAHPYHVSLAELEFNRKDHSLEVALKVLPCDIESAISQQVGRQIRLETYSKLSEEIIKYLKAHFKVKTKAGLSLRSYTWIGQQLSVKEMWLFFEISVPKGCKNLDGFEFENTLLFNVSRNQVNTVNVKDNGPLRTLTFSKGKSKQKLRKRIKKRAPAKAKTKTTKKASEAAPVKPKKQD